MNTNTILSYENILNIYRSNEENRNIWVDQEIWLKLKPYWTGSVSERPKSYQVHEYGKTTIYSVINRKDWNATVLNYASRSLRPLTSRDSPTIIIDWALYTGTAIRI